MPLQLSFVGCMAESSALRWAVWIGLLGGPAGIAVGSGIGVVAGLIGDMYTASVDEEFLAEVSTALTPGKCAVVAEVDEDWVSGLPRACSLGSPVHLNFASGASDRGCHWSPCRIWPRISPLGKATVCTLA
jgi:hypothetical protein